MRGDHPTSPHLSTLDKATRCSVCVCTCHMSTAQHSLKELFTTNRLGVSRLHGVCVEVGSGGGGGGGGGDVSGGAGGLSVCRSY